MTTHWRYATGPNKTQLTAIGAVLAALAMFLPVSATAQPVQPVPESPSRMRLDIDSLSPRVITAATASVTVTGKVTNTGDRRIDGIKVQLLRGEPVTTEKELRNAKNALTDSARSPFVGVSAALERGQSALVALTVPVRGTEGSLLINEPGVYPVLVNVNGTPEFGGQARLAAVSVLVPALSVPGGPAVPAPPDPAQVTVLWPLIDDHPRLVLTEDGQPTLADDELASSLGPGGRLFGLLNAAQQAQTANSAVLNGLCFAIDPDLLQTVVRMTQGYRVRGGDGQLVDGKGALAAKTWLARLRALTTGRCVIAVPFADADLVALSRAGAVDLEQLAIAARSVVADVLKPVQPLNGVVWPVAGTLDQRTLVDLATSEPTTVLVDPAHLQHVQGTAPYAIGDSQTTSTVRAAPIDGLVSDSLDDGLGWAPSAISPATTPAEERPISVQNGLAALAFQVAFADRGTAGRRSILIAPPRRWAAPATELGVFLQTLRQLLTDKLATAQPLDQVSVAPKGTASGLDYTAANGAAELPATVTADVDKINTAQRDLLGAMHVDNTAPVDPNTLVEPVQYGLLRATSAGWRGQAELSERAVAEVGGHLDALRGQVWVDNPDRPLTLASGSSPIPVLLRNAMPVAVQVRIKLADTPGLRPKPIPDVTIPARGAINQYLQAEVVRAGRFTLDVSLTTPGGTPLGSPARLQLTSTSYGAITLIITGTAAAVLFLLVGLRIYRRIRAARTTMAADGPPIRDGLDEGK